MKKDRHYGIDAARLFAMLLVVMWHYVIFGGAVAGVTSTERPIVYYSAKWLASLSVCCVDLFALVSGYVGVMAGRSIKLIENALPPPEGDCAADASEALLNVNTGSQHLNDSQFAQILQHYPELKQKLVRSE